MINVLNAFLKNASVPILNMESSTQHPLQSVADLVTIEEYKAVKKPKIVLSWAPLDSEDARRMRRL